MLFSILNVTILYFEHKQTRKRQIERERMQMHFYRGSVFRLRNPHSHWLRHRSRRDEHIETWNCSLETSRFCWREHPVCSIPCSLCYLETQSGQWDECFTRSVTRRHTHTIRSANRQAPSHLTTDFLVRCVSAIDDLITPEWWRDTGTICTTSLRRQARGIWNHRGKCRCSILPLRLYLIWI